MEIKELNKKLDNAVRIKNSLWKQIAELRPRLEAAKSQYRQTENAMTALMDQYQAASEEAESLLREIRTTLNRINLHGK